MTFFARAFLVWFRLHMGRSFAIPVAWFAAAAAGGAVLTDQ